MPLLTIASSARTIAGAATRPAAARPFPIRRRRVIKSMPAPLRPRALEARSCSTRAPQQGTTRGYETTDDFLADGAGDGDAGIVPAAAADAGRDPGPAPVRGGLPAGRCAGLRAQHALLRRADVTRWGRRPS